MPYLGDYLGHLIGEITLARVRADLEAIRVAELYASDPLLKGFPVPRFRLPSVTLDVPVAIRGLDRPRDQPTRGGVTLGAAQAVLEVAVDRLTESHALELSADQKRRVADQLKRLVRRRVGTDIFTAGRLKPLTDDLARDVMAMLAEVVSAEVREPAHWARIGEELRLNLLSGLLSHQGPSERLEVLATTAELRDAGPRDMLTQLRLTISEEGVEWTVVDQDGQSRDRLVPE